MITYSPADGVRIALHLLPADEGVTVWLLAGDDPTAITAEAHTVLQHIEEVQRMASQSAFHDDVGRGLFRSLLPGVLGDQFRAVYTQATVSGARLTLELHIDPARVRLARYPWELLHDGTRFLLQTGAVDLVRMVPYPALYPEATPDAVESDDAASSDNAGPLRVLIATATPDAHPPLAGSFDALESAFAAQQRADAIDIAPLFPPTWDALMDWLLAGGPDVCHVESHADFTRTGRLLLEDACGKADPVASDLLVSALGSADVRLMLLSAGVTEYAGNDSMLSSAAATLVLLGLPAVIAAQHTMPQADVILFAKAVYAALLAGADVESAVLAGRRALSRSLYWYAPTLTRRRVVLPAEAGTRLPRQLYTAASGSVQMGWTTRAALWLAPAHALPPATSDVARLVGEEIAPHEPDIEPRQRPAAGLPDAYPPGALEVRLTAPGCDVHTRTRTVTLCADRAVPPVWFALTPRQPGPVMLTFEVWHGSHRRCTLTHPLHATTDVPDHAAARPVLIAHGKADADARGSG
ncbi:MAG: CHAT domain-containing protein [Anaerolineae bacterium]|nr:CHAT domain-containing protein [Anaerolineae bacterium]